MFGNLKDIYQMQAKAREIQKKLADEKIEVEKDGVKIVMTGNQEIVSIELNPELAKSDQEKILADLFNQAIKQVQQLMAKSMMG